MRMSVLASGSTGNATYIEHDQQSILIDVGLSGKKLEGLMQQINRKIQDVNAILITHEHVDHIKGLGVIARKYHIPIYANEQTWQQIELKDQRIPNELKYLFNPYEHQTIANIDIESYNVSHDAIDPQFYVFHKDGKKFSMITDTGYVSDRMKGYIERSDCYIFESNHDVNMLRTSHYPWKTQQRILSDLGHISNIDAGHAIADVIGEQTKRIYLSHLSQDNNMQQLAYDSVSEILEQRDVDTNIVELKHTYKDKSTMLYEI
ncbi:MBL fold metallo-hydrolase [Abyssicoccus albus]|uniref:Phosphoribosyl 1,2-cyclic phosphodiesterase n=1 Tax=Abyssicoccus albus TaxID=1817405 RepID=A0A3N5BIY4_9BACL|nr:phosphoribosyl 1,2-cyclic phosphodiesterase [Abyssicoccus albus]